MTSEVTAPGAIVVTGAAGFIGSALCAALVARGTERVTAVDVAPIDAWDRLAAVQDSALVRVRADVARPAELAGVLRGHDAVVHLASGTDMARGAREPAEDFSGSLAMTLAVAEASRAAGVGTVVFASSSAVYGELAARRAAREDDGPLLPISTYGAAKLAGEGLVSAYAALFGFRAILLRPGTVIGPGMDRGVLPSVVAQLASGARRLRLLGDGTQARSFVLVADVAAAVVHLLAVAGEGTSVYNVAGEGTTTVAEVARIALAAAGRDDVPLEFAGTERGWRGDVPVVALDVSRLAATGWTPRPSGDAVSAAATALLADPPRLRAGEPGRR